MPVRPIDPRATWALRQRVLRPHQVEAEMDWPGDHAAGAIHFGAFAGERLVGVASVVPEAMSDGAAALRLRGMAVEPDLRGRGVGAELLRACIAHAERANAVLWCSARLAVEPFYLRAGFARMGPEPFEVPNIGPHVALRLG